MQELEKILKDIEQAKGESWYRMNDHVTKSRIDGAIERITDIIRKHMNDGWIPVGEQLPEKNEYFVETSGDKDFPNGYYKRLEIAYMTDTIEYVHGYYDGYKWMDKYHDTIKNVVAWRIHEPYRPERSDNHGGE